ncbi:endonuclease/exonuclease/phosphatase family protein [Saccharibacillus sp. JS10]|uniref:endonuclease/exonuclease/phosphatase family protein n=1 Tax=Saccharibacillus sp. JS10 TaxID=2950552 RepID=UPI00210A6E0C|nr:endonuclease/exonuclease/phosphatase family protein [Saccharibacillus sp. JS10]MCQ4085700.1 endonuclease/exonuclease/phosphatase family protein [Saccharibacillus sp. JS10]
MNSSTESQGVASLNIMTFNLRTHTANDLGNEWVQRAPWAVKTIADHAPSIVGVQEAYVLMLNDLQQGLTDYRWIGEGRQGGDQDEHCAIFYRHAEFEVLDHGQFWLSGTPHTIGSLGWDSDYPRICTWGRFRHIASGRTLSVYNTHFDHIGAAARIEGAKLVAAYMAEQSKTYPQDAAILMGDMNGVPSDLPLRYLRGEAPEQGEVPALQDAYTVLEHNLGRTFHDFQGGVEGEPIDYIFAGQHCQLKSAVIDRREFDGKYPSDHYPLIATIQLLEN